MIEVTRPNRIEPNEVAELVNYTFSQKHHASGLFTSFFDIWPNGKKTQRTEAYDAKGYFCLLTPSL